MPRRGEKKATVSFRVSESVYQRMGEEATARGVSLAEFARTATIARTIYLARKRGQAWADAENWEEITRAVDDLLAHEEADRHRRS